MKLAELPPDYRLSPTRAARCLGKRRKDVEKWMLEGTITCVVEDGGKLRTTPRWLAEFNESQSRSPKPKEATPVKRRPGKSAQVNYDDFYAGLT